MDQQLSPSGLLEPLPDCSRGGVSSFGRMGVGAVVSVAGAVVHRHRSSSFRFLWLLVRILDASVKCPAFVSQVSSGLGVPDAVPAGF
jgi:hypothetical protein